MFKKKAHLYKIAPKKRKKTKKALKSKKLAPAKETTLKQRVPLQKQNNIALQK